MKAVMAIVCICLSVGAASAVEYIDIEVEPVSMFISPESGLSQSFKPNANNITAVSIFMRDATTANVTIQILDSVCGNILASGSGSGHDWVKCDLVGAIAVVPGDTYVINVLSDSWFAGNAGHPGLSYPDGNIYWNCDLFDTPDDLAFRTWTDEQAVPNTEATWGAIKSLFR